MSRHPFRTPPPEVKRDYISLLDWIREEHPKMPLAKAQRIAQIQTVRAAAVAVREEGLYRISGSDD